jgi:hypothetical protein
MAELLALHNLVDRHKRDSFARPIDELDFL